MSNHVILFDDDKQTCQTLYHSKRLMVCLHPACLTYPLICCTDCFTKLHTHDANNISMEKNLFIDQTNKRYQDLYEYMISIDAEHQDFERKFSSGKRFINCEIEKMRRQINKIIDQLKEQINNLLDTQSATIKNTIKSKLEKTKDAIYSIKTVNINQIKPEQLSSLITTLWHTDYDEEKLKIKSFFPTLQKQLIRKLSQLEYSVLSQIAVYCKELIDQFQEQMQEFKVEIKASQVVKKLKYNITQFDLGQQQQHKSNKIISKPACKETVKSKCPQCGSPEMFFWITQLRPVDEGVSVYYECTKCQFEYRQDN